MNNNMAKIIRWKDRPHRIYLDGSEKQWASSITIAEDVGARLCNISIISKKPGFTPLDILHYHPNREEFFVVLEGRAKALIDDTEVLLEPGMVIFVPAKEKHYLNLRAVPIDDKEFKMLEFGAPLGTNPDEDVFLGVSRKVAYTLIKTSTLHPPKQP